MFENMYHGYSLLIGLRFIEKLTALLLVLCSYPELGEVC